jgi:hypothetical protein
MTGTGKDSLSRAEAFRKKIIRMEIGEDLARDVANSAVGDSGIAKRRSEDRAAWVGECRFLLFRAGVELAVFGAGGRAGWAAMRDDGFIRFAKRSGTGGWRAKVTAKGARFFAADCGPIGQAWRFAPGACRRFILLLAARLREWYEGGSFAKRRDVIASDEAARAAAKLPVIEEKRLLDELERLLLVPKTDSSQDIDRAHSLLAKDRKEIRDGGWAYLQRDNSPVHDVSEDDILDVVKLLTKERRAQKRKDVHFGK